MVVGKMEGESRRGSNAAPNNWLAEVSNRRDTVKVRECFSASAGDGLFSGISYRRSFNFSAGLIYKFLPGWAWILDRLLYCRCNSHSCCSCGHRLPAASPAARGR